ncbi:MAG: putative integral membrane protein (TIGR00698 family) [Spirosomataceae bacterium]|jgi:uncharacterized integral membrane protein (TIGR00698 family)
MKIKQITFFLLVVFTCFPFVGASLALILGVGFGLVIGNPFQEKVSFYGSLLLRTSVVGLGFGINSHVLVEAGKNSVGVTTFFVFFVLSFGFLLGKLLKIDKVITLLISVGTAICGGSAIAAVSSVVKANPSQISIATATVFLLNAIALFIFPAIGHFAGLSQLQFGTWAAIAIHDTSSVVGAATKYGSEALEIASITKMLRILWIIPVSLALLLNFEKNRETFKIPGFIIGFVMASLLFSSFPEWQANLLILNKIAKQLLVVSLFLIGSGVSLTALKTVGGKVLLQAVMLWVIVSSVALVYVINFL